MFILMLVILFLSYFQCSVDDSKWFIFHLIKCVALKGFVNNFACCLKLRRVGLAATETLFFVWF